MVLLSRREVIVDLPSAAATTAVSLPPAIHPELDEGRAMARLGVPQSSVTAALRRMDRFIGKPSCYLYGGSASGAGYEFTARLNGAELVGRGLWCLRGRGTAGLALDRAVAVTSAMTTVGWLDRNLRYLAGCAFGGITLFVFGNSRVKFGLVMPGHHFDTRPSHLEVRL